MPPEGAATPVIVGLTVSTVRLNAGDAVPEEPVAGAIRAVSVKAVPVADVGAKVKVLKEMIKEPPAKVATSAGVIV